MGFIRRKNLDNLLKSKSWINATVLKENVLFTFKPNNELLVTHNGIVFYNSYEVMPDGKSITWTKDELTIHLEVLYYNSDFII